MVGTFLRPLGSSIRLTSMLEDSRTPVTRVFRNLTRLKSGRSGLLQVLQKIVTLCLLKNFSSVSRTLLEPSNLTTFRPGLQKRHASRLLL